MGKDKSFEGLRGVAALTVVFAHLIPIFYLHLAHWSVPTAGFKAVYEWEKYAAHPIATIFFNGGFAVSVFFVLSGYVLTIKFFRDRDPRVAWLAAIKRYPRLMIPAFWAVMFAWALLSLGLMQNHRAVEIPNAAGWPVAYYQQQVSFAAALWEATVTAATTGVTPLNSPLWSIMIELKGSIGLFIVFALFGRTSLLVTSAAFVAFCFWLYPANSVMALLFVMLAGAMLNVVRPRLLGRSWVGIAMIIFGLYLGMYCYYEPLYWPLMELRFPTLPSPMPDWNDPGAKTMLLRCVGAVFLVYGMVANTAVTRVLSMRVPAYLGKISFACYLIHWPIICSFTYWSMATLYNKIGIEFQLATLTTFVASLAVIISASHLFERYVDRSATQFSNWFAMTVARMLTLRFRASAAAPETAG